VGRYSGKDLYYIIPDGSSFEPLNERRRSLVTHDGDTHDAVVAQEFGPGRPRVLNRGETPPHARQVGRGAPPHGDNQLEHVRDGPLCLPAARCR
jgi:hypothetical protein